MAASASAAGGKAAATEIPPTTAAVERTLALIKPDACGRPWMEKVMKKVEEESEDGPVERWVEGEEERASDKAAEIIKRIQSSGFLIAKQLTRRLTKGQAESFYAEHRGKPFFDKLTTFMSSGPIVSLVLEREMAISGWRALMGATNTLKARAEAEEANPLDETKWSLRALFGTDGTHNATHGSDSPFSAMREQEFFFPQKPVWERSVLVLLPEAAAREAEVLQLLSQHEFVLVARTQRTLTAEQTSTLCGAGSPAGTAAAAQAGECVVLVLERICAVRQLYLAVGPLEGKSVAIDKVPGSINAVYGPGAADGDAVAALAPETRDRAAWLIESLFEGPLPVEHTLAVIKPGTADEHRDAIVRDIVRHGFTVAAETRVSLATEQAEAFYEEHRGKPFFERLTSFMASSPLVAMVLAKPGAIQSWRALMGPTSTDRARIEAPASLRARFGVDGTRNATHGSDSAASAAREIRFFFPDFAPHTLPDDAEAAAFVAKHTVATVYNPVENNSIPATLRSVLVQAMTALAKERNAAAAGTSESKGDDEEAKGDDESSQLEAVRALGNWLVHNNPRRGKAAEADPAAIRASRSSVATRAEAAAAAAASGAGADQGPSVEVLSTVVHGTVRAVPAAAAGSVRGRSIVFVLGAPGSGKGTQCARIKEEFGFVHLSTGDLLRAEVASGSELGKEMAETMRVGGLVSLGTVLHLLRQAMDVSPTKKFLIDGYPRSMKQAFAFEQAVGKPTMVLSFAAEEATLEARLVKRGETSGRADDNVESIRKRFATFSAESAPVIDFYSHVGLVRAVGTEGRSPDQVFAEARRHFLPELACVLGGPASGRSTMCARAARELGWTHVSTGALLRAEAVHGTDLGETVSTLLERGDLVPADVMLRVLQSALARNEEGTGRFLLDGYPRTAEQMSMMEAVIGRPSHVLLCTAPDSVLRARAKRRGSTGGRRDTSASAVEHQLATFRDKTSMVAEEYEKQALLARIDTNRPQELAFADFRRALMPQVVFVLGGPGSGKGTQCARLVEEFGFVHLSAGDLLRAERERGSPDGEMIERHIRGGTIVPVSVTLQLLKEAMLASGARRFLIDGFPRAMDQAEGYEELLGLPSGVLFFDCPEATMRSRLLERGKTSGRTDDNEETIMKRFRTFQEQSMPVVLRYARRGLVLPVDATASVDEVYVETRAHFLPQVVFVLGGPGSGKGTQCARIKEEFGFVHLSMGDLLRAEVASGSELGKEMEDIMRAGELVPTDTTVVMLREAMRRCSGSRFLIDGFPRSREQAEAFERLVCQPHFVLFFDCPEATTRSRLLKRGKTSGRADDNEETIMKRFRTFQEQSLPAITDYKGRGLLREVSAVPSPDVVYASVRTLFQPELVVMCGASGSGRGEFTSRAGLQLGYHTLRVPKLLQEAAAQDTPRGAALRRALAMHRTAPLEATLAVLREAMARSRATRFILDGFPRLASEGFPSVHDQVFALEASVGPVRGCVCLDAHLAQRKARIRGVPTVGQEAALVRSVNAFKREKLPVVAYFEAIGKTRVVDTTPPPDEVFQDAAPFLE